MRKIFSSQSAFLHPRLLLGVAICLTGISLALVVFGQNRWNNARPNSPGPGVIVTGSPDVTPTPTPTPSCVPPPPGMVSWWPGDGNANDIWDGNPGTLQGGATFALGEVGQAFSFNASTNSGVLVPSSASLNPTEAITIDAWVNPSSYPNTGPAVVRKDTNTVGTTQYSLSVGDGVNTGVLHCNIGGSIGATGGSVPLNQWSHVACTYDRQNLRAYVNGTQVAFTAGTQAIPVSSENLGIGKELGFTDRNFDGLVDEVEILNRALSQSEIQSIVNAGSSGKCKPQCVPPPANMVAWYPGDGNANDISGDNYNGTLSGGVTFTPGEVNQAFTFNGTDGEVILPNSASAPLLNFGPTDSFTVDAWLKPDPSVLGTQRVVVSLTYVCSPEEIVLALLVDGRIDFDFRDSNGIAIVTVSPSSILDGNWHHVAGVRDVTPHTATLYLDGTPVSSVADTTTGTFTRADGQNRIGSIAVACPTDRYFWKGQIDEVEVFRRALSQSEIQAIVNARSAGKCRACAPPPANMVSWWPGDGNANDIVGTNNGTAQNGVTFPAGEVGQAFGLSASSSQYVTVPDSPSLRVTQFTLDGWVSFNSTVGGGCCNMLFSKSFGSGDAESYAVWYSGNALHGDTCDGPSFAANCTVLDFPFIPTLGVWYHIAYTFGGSTHALYLNGLQVASLANTRAPTYDGTDFSIGSETENGSRTYYFDGKIDEVELFNRALSQPEIQSIVNAGSAGKCKPTGCTLTCSPTLVVTNAAGQCGASAGPPGVPAESYPGPGSRSWR